jgi:hypothetical protein
MVGKYRLLTIGIGNQIFLNIGSPLISVQPDAQNIGISINQTILWPRRLIAIPNVPSNKETTPNTEEASN